MKNIHECDSIPSKSVLITNLSDDGDYEEGQEWLMALTHQLKTGKNIGLHSITWRSTWMSFQG